ncbi:GNAT family protein [Priestia megaterium]|uniref:GNAT family N-acetyltransferase n=1 Tax=Priestia megaterium TaxID=1404 RepID=UPI003176C28D
MRINNNLHMRALNEEDLKPYWELVYRESNPEWKKWDAPYYEHKNLSYEDFLNEKKTSLIQTDNRWGLFVNNQLIGIVSYYWEHKPSNWLETGIVIYDSNYWNGGYGTIFFRNWIEHLFTTLPLVRVGFTTWSGNERMIRLGEKLGMKLEGRLRKCRLYNGVYYDSIRMGVLREEWEQYKEIVNF